MAFRINFYGGPGVGKSTLAARVYAELNRAGAVSVELVQEFIKVWAYEGKQLDTFDQVYIFGQQLWAEHCRFKAGVEVIITDAPVLLQCVYMHRLNPTVSVNLQEVALEYEKAYPALNFLVLRSVPYRREGRYQDEPELQELDDSIKGFMDLWRLPYVIVTPNESEIILQIVKETAYKGA